MYANGPEAPTGSSGSHETMKNLGFGKEYDDVLPSAELEEHLNFGEGDNGFEGFIQEGATFHGMLSNLISEMHKNSLEEEADNRFEDFIQEGAAFHCMLCKPISKMHKISQLCVR
jgi:hypothetical protein